jgi:tetratricopeptide (TPR) repeat protein
MSRIEGNKTSIQNALFFLKAEATIEDVRSLVASLALPGDTVFSAYKAIQDHTTALPNLLLDYLFNDFEDDEKLIGEISRHLFAKNRYRAAERFVRTSLLLNHGKPMTHRILGVVMIELNDPASALFHFRRATELEGESAVNLRHLAWGLRKTGQLAAARQHYARSDILEPGNIMTLYGLARIEDAEGNLDEALSLIDRILTLTDQRPVDHRTLLLRASVLEGAGRADEALAILDQIEPAGVACQARGLILDKRGEYDAAFASFAASKEWLRTLSHPPYTAEFHRQRCASLKEFFTRDRVSQMPRASLRADEPQPIFVVGFPRSGTTLIQQTLSLDPDIAAAGELPTIDRLSGLTERSGRFGRYPFSLLRILHGDKREMFSAMRDHYLYEAKKALGYKEGLSFFVDKMPLNETHLGLIHLLFPASRIIHIVRHPLDVILSVYFRTMSHGANCALRLETIAGHYALLHDLVGHYKKELDLSLLTLRYEQFVAAQSDIVRGMMTFVGRPFHDGLLDFQKNSHYEHSAGANQVRAPLSEKYVYRYRRYIKHLEPILDIVRPIMEDLGYDL